MEKDDQTHEESIPRRSYLKFAGVTVASLGASLTAGVSETRARQTGTEIQVEKQYGFGGKPLTETTTVLAESQSIASESEPNDTRSEATPIDTGVDVSGTLDSGEVDWFAFNLSSDTTATVEFSKERSSGVTLLAFYDVDGSFVDRIYLSASGPVSLSATTSESGTHYAQVVDIEDGSSAYTLRVESSSSSTSDDIDYGMQGYGEDGYGGLEA